VQRGAASDRAKEAGRVEETLDSRSLEPIYGPLIAELIKI
jgi:hypothetical protein